MIHGPTIWNIAVNSLIPNLVFNFFKYYRRPRTPLIRLSVAGPRLDRRTKGIRAIASIVLVSYSK